MEFGERTPSSACVFSPVEKNECVRSTCRRGVNTSAFCPLAPMARGQNARVLTPPPAGMTERTRLSSRGEYTQGTSCPDPELQWLRIAVTITSVVSAVTPKVWIQGFFHVVISARAYCMLLTFLARLHEVICVNTKTAFCIITRIFDSHFSLLKDTHVRVSFRSCEYKTGFMYHHARF